VRLQTILCKSALAATLSVSALSAGAQQNQAKPALPDDPSATTLSGSVVDANGGLVPDATVTVVSGTEQHTAVSDDDGEFRLTGLPAGPFQLTVTAKDLKPALVQGSLTAGQHSELDPIVMRMGARDTNVEVTASQAEIAEAEVKVEEKQRLVGVIPNFYVTYNWHAEPLDATQKWELAYRSLVDWTTFAFTGAIAGIQYEQGSLSGFGYGPGGYFKRYAANFGNAFFGSMLGGAVLPIVFKQDPRYFYKGTGSVRSRFWYAMSTAVISRGDNGKWQPGYANILGNYGAGALSNLYYPASSRQGAKLTLENGSIGIAFDGFGNVFQEFLLKRFTPSVKNAGQTEP
jgi:hypothetical protein